MLEFEKKVILVSGLLNTHQTGSRIKTGRIFALSWRCISVPNFESLALVVLEISQNRV